MKAVLAFVMKGRMQAVMVATVLAVVALQLTPLGLLSAAVVGLAVLQQGWKEGLLVLASCLLAIAGLGGLLFQQPLVLALMGLSIWLPIAGLSAVLGRTDSLRLTIETAAVLAAVLVGLQYLVLDDPGAFWGSVLHGYMAQMMDSGAMSEGDVAQVVQVLGAWMPGGAATAWMMGTVITLFLVRAGSYLLGREGSFGAEFRELRFGRWALYLLPVLLLVGVVFTGGQPNFAAQLYMIGMAMFLLQGISVAHSLVAINGAATGWLVGMYVAMLLITPHGAMAVAAAGYADGWFDFRAKARARRADEPGDD